MRLFHDITQEIYEIKIGIVKQWDSVLETAQKIYYMYDNDLFRKVEQKNYNDIYEFCKCEFDLNRKTVNKYLDVVHIYFTYRKSNEYTDYDTYVFDLKHAYFEGMNFSQLYACIGLSVIECGDLLITDNTSVHEIEKRKKAYKKLKDDIVVSETKDQEEKIPDNEKVKTFDSLSDTKKGINIFEKDFIPEDSEYEFIFRNEDTLIRGRKRKANVNTAIKMLRTIVENNSEEEFYYAVVKIKKPL